MGGEDWQIGVMTPRDLPVFILLHAQLIFVFSNIMEGETASVAATSGGPTASVLEELAAYTACDVRQMSPRLSYQLC